MMKDSHRSIDPATNKRVFGIRIGFVKGVLLCFDKLEKPDTQNR